LLGLAASSEGLSPGPLQTTEHMSALLLSPNSLGEKAGNPGASAAGGEASELDAKGASGAKNDDASKTVT